MTRPNPLVLDGNEVKARIQAERTFSGKMVHIDWVRFTVHTKHAPIPTIEQLFPVRTDSIWDPQTRHERMQKVLNGIQDPEWATSTQALVLADEVAAALGPEFSVFPERRKGHDFYRYRWSIERHGQEVGWVGFLSSGESPRQQAQSKTIHANIYGSACTFAQRGWNDAIAALVDQHKADITRIDLALDFFDGMPSGRTMDSLKTDYMSGAMDVLGKRPKCNQVGDWCNGAERSFYFGSKEAGKQTNVYEKGDQLYGVNAHSPWVRVELRYGNKLRVLSSDMLKRPSDFFGGASEWHAAILTEAQKQFVPEPVKCTPRLAVETVAAEVKRNIRWLLNTAAPSVAAAFQFMGFDEFLDVVSTSKLPGRLQRFSKGELLSAFERFKTVEGPSPAFA